MRLNENIKLGLGPFLGFAMALVLFRNGLSYESAAMAGIAVWMALWWTMEIVSIYLTALIPAFALPLLGVLSMNAIAQAYLPQIIFLFIGGFILAFAVERWDLHKRIAFKILLKVGTKASSLLFGFMLVSYLLSMWILNTATVILLLPAVLAVIGNIENAEEKKLYAPFLLGLAFASSIGGITTIIGTAPNMFLMDFYNEQQGFLPQINFLNWFLMALPLSLLLFILCFVLLRFIFLRKNSDLNIKLDYCREELKKLGPMSYEEKVISLVFSLLILAWFTARDIPFAQFEFKGWMHLLPEASYVKESTLAMLAAFLLFIIPSKTKKGRILAWRDAQRIPLGVLFLFGGGFALAKGFDSSGLSAIIASQLDFASAIPLFASILILSLFMTFFTEFSSNTSSTVLVLPLLASMLSAMDVAPAFILVPVTISASCAFMLPVATPPNTIVFGSDKLKIKDMMRAGIWMNLISAIIVSVYIYYCLAFFFGI